MSEIRISDLLQKYNKLTLVDQDIKSAVVESLHSTLGLEVDTKDISYNNGVVYINVSPLVKSRIHTSSGKIKKHLTVLLDKKTPKKIR